MADLGDNADSHERIRLVNTTGCPVTLGHRDRVERIREAMVDLQVAIDGCVAQSPDRLADTVASLARRCSHFPEDQLDARPDAAEPTLARPATFVGWRNWTSKGPVRFQPSGEPLLLLPIDIARGYIQATKLDEEISEPEFTEVIPVRPTADLHRHRIARAPV